MVKMILSNYIQNMPFPKIKEIYGSISVHIPLFSLLDASSRKCKSCVYVNTVKISFNNHKTQTFVLLYFNQNMLIILHTVFLNLPLLSSSCSSSADYEKLLTLIAVFSYDLFWRLSMYRTYISIVKL